ncbi:MAG: hypothetical protein O6944_04875, partial [Gammaproteobacteria bacterium]|nr:hypothetical protein [Gammaproteobacteria bacterium]
IEQIRGKLVEAGAEYRQTRPHDTVTTCFEEKYKGPDGVMIDISGEGWAGAEPPSAERGQVKEPPVVNKIS